MVARAKIWTANVRHQAEQTTWIEFIRCTLRRWTGESRPGLLDQAEHVWQALKSKLA
jgi:hypothetical protein